MDLIHILDNGLLLLSNVDNDLRIRGEHCLLVEILHAVKLTEHGKIAVLSPHIGERSIFPLSGNTDELVRSNGKECHLGKTAGWCDAINLFWELDRSSCGIREGICRGDRILLFLLAASDEQNKEEE